MHIDLLDHLRCPADHAECWLVAAIERMADRHVERGTLGCPVCRRSYEIQDFAACFATPAETVENRAHPTPDEVTRLAAMLDLRVPGGFVGLHREWAPYAIPLAFSFDVHCVVLDDRRSIRPAEGVSLLIVDTALPLARGVLRGIALGIGALQHAVHRALRPGGRVVGAAGLDVPAGIALMARDVRSWVGERLPDATPVVSLARPR